MLCQKRGLTAFSIWLMGLGGSAQTGHFKLHPPAPPDIRVVVHYNAQSEQVKRNEDEFFAKHPELNHPRNGTRRNARIMVAERRRYLICLMLSYVQTYQ